jgi:hypothetical protein
VSFYTYFLDKDTTLTGILKNKSYFSCVFARIFVPLQGILNNTHFLEQIKSTNLTATIPDMEIIQTRYQHKNKAGTDAPKYLILSL